MCIIMACPPNHTPSYNDLLDATLENSDGSGFMIKSPGGLIIERSAKDDHGMIDAFLDYRKKWPDVWGVWHSRLATHGAVEDDNTHPFKVPGQPWALVHNGILPLSDGPFNSDRSDSRILAEDHISAATWEDIRSCKTHLENWLQGDKVVILSGQREKGGSCIILNEHLGTWQGNGCWYSHPLYRWASSYTSKARHVSPMVQAALDAEDDDEWQRAIDEDDAKFELWLMENPTRPVHEYDNAEMVDRYYQDMFTPDDVDDMEDF